MKKIIILLSFFNFCCCSIQEIKIIELEPNEFMLYKKLRLKSVEEFPEAFGSTYDEEVKLSNEDWQRRLKLNMLFARKEDQIIGMIGAVIDLREKVNHHAHIISFYILPEFRGKNIGFLLINTLIDKLRNEKNIKTFSLKVTTTLTNAIKLYKKLGFTIIGTAKYEYYINNTYYDQYLMMLSYITEHEQTRSTIAVYYTSPF